MKGPTIFATQLSRSWVRWASSSAWRRPRPVAAQIEKPGDRHAQEQMNAIAKQPDKGFAGRVDEAVVRVAFRSSATTRTACQPPALFSRGEVMSIPASWLVAQRPPSIQRTYRLH